LSYSLSQLPSYLQDRLQENAETGCWEWIGYGTHDGYGLVRFRGKQYYSLLTGVPHSGPLDHLCARRSGVDRVKARRCVNPLHLDPVTVKVNNLRGEGPGGRNARKTHCPKGHPYDGDNLLAEKADGGRYITRRCKQCKAENSRRNYERNLEKRLEYARNKRASLTPEQHAAVLVYAREWRQNNLDYARAYDRERGKIRGSKSNLLQKVAS
jgi:hypothetical protein